MNSTVLVEALFAQEMKKSQVEMFKSSKKDQQDNYLIKGLSNKISPDDIDYEWLGSVYWWLFQEIVSGLLGYQSQGSQGIHYKIRP